MEQLLIYIKDNLKEKKNLDFFFHSFTNIKCTGYKYPDLTEENYKMLVLDLSNSIKESNSKNNLVIIFDQEYMDKFTCLNGGGKTDKIVTNKPFILLCFPNKNNGIDNIIKKFKKKEYITYLIKHRINYCIKNLQVLFILIFY